MIPKIAHFYFAGRAWSFMRYLTLYSFCKLNPRWEVFLHVPTEAYKKLRTWSSVEHEVKYIGLDYYDGVVELPIMIREVSIKHPISDVQRSDLMRLELLRGVGGWFFDTDILFVKPMSKLKIPKRKKQVLCKNKNGTFLIGAQASCRFNDYFAEMHVAAIENVSKLINKSGNYQTLGTMIMTPSKPNEEDTYWMKPSIFYKYTHKQLDGVFGDGELDKDCIGIHWYGGHPTAGKWENKLKESNLDEYDNLFCKEAYKIWH